MSDTRLLMVVFMATTLLVSCSSEVSEGVGGVGNAYSAKLVQTSIWGQISSGMAHACALTSQGRVACWGKGGNGRLGNRDPSHADREYAVTVVVGATDTSPLGDIVQIDVGSSHTCALSYRGEVVCWGEGGNGRLGNGDPSGTDKDYPVMVMEAADSTTPLGNIVQISSGESHTCALTSHGGVVCWGEASRGELGDGSFLQKNTPTAVVSSEDSTDPLVNIVQISSGDTHTCALTAQGGVVCWGEGGNGRLGNRDPSNGNKNHPVAVVAADGESGLLQDIEQISSGSEHTCALSSFGDVLCWGGGSGGELGNGGTGSTNYPVMVVSESGSTNPLKDIVQISSGGHHTCALTSRDEVRCWGRGTEGQLGNDNSTDKDHPVTVVEAEGSTTPLAKIVQISSGGNYTCALSFGGNVMCWGSGTDGRLGDGGTSDKDTAVTVVDGSHRPLRLGIRKLGWGCYDSGSCRRLGLTKFYHNDGGGSWGQISSGGEHTCALTFSGKVLCWGGGEHGQLGNDDIANKDHPVSVVDSDGSTASLENIVQISAGEHHTCALADDGEVQCWGLGSSGQLGNDDAIDKDHPVTVVEASGSANPLGDIVQISSKANHVCAVTSTGGVFCWGQGGGGELGNNDIVDKAHPVEVVEKNGSTDPLTDIVQVSSGWSHTCALTRTGKVLCWGNGIHGQLGNNGTDNKSHPVAVVEAEGSDEPLGDIVQISSGKEHSCALTIYGRILCWGRGAEGQLGNDGTDNKYAPVAVADRNGGTNTLSNIIQINSGYEHTCALTSEGEVVCWGNGASGRLGNDGSSDANKAHPVTVVEAEGSTTPLGNIIEISSAREHTCALTSAGSVLCWGSGVAGRLGNDGTDDEYAPVAVVEGDGGVWPLRLGVYERSWACYRDGTCQEEPLPEFYENDGGGVLGQLAVGKHHACAVTSTGEVRCWGKGTEGQLGNDDTIDKDHPVTVVDGDGSTTALGGIIQISAGESHTCVLTSGGGVLCWGEGSKGRLGNNDAADKNHPVSVVDTDGNPLSDIVQISVGWEHVCALTSSREVWCWGAGGSGRLGNNDATGEDKNHAVAVVSGEGDTALLADIIQIDAGGRHTCALTGRGEIVCWGSGRDGQLGNDDEVNKSYPVAVVETEGSTTPMVGIVQVSAGETHTCALNVQGEVLCWGNGPGGRLGDNASSNEDRSYPTKVVDGNGSTTPLNNVVQVAAGFKHTCALLSSGQVRCWGREENGRLGNDESDGTKNYPVTVVDGDGSTNPLDNIVYIGPGAGDHNCALTAGGGLVCWGSGDHGQLGNDRSGFGRTENIYNRDHPVSVVDGDGSTTAINIGTKKHSWVCYKDGTCNFLHSSDSY